jgi:hypothetical protein
VHMARAVAAGDMSQEEADTNVERLRNGEHPKGLRARLSAHKGRGIQPEASDPGR